MSPTATVVMKGEPVAVALRARDMPLDLKHNRIWINHPEQGLLMVSAGPRVCSFLFLLAFWRHERNHGLMPTDFPLGGSRGTAFQARREFARSFESTKLPRDWANLVVRVRTGKPKGYLLQPVKARIDVSEMRLYFPDLMKRVIRGLSKTIRPGSRRYPLLQSLRNPV